MSLPELMTPEKVHLVARCLTNIDHLDRQIEELQVALERRSTDAELIGEKVAQALPKGMQPVFSYERLGMVALAALVNALLFERQQQEKVVDGYALVRDAPCVPHQLSTIWEALDGGVAEA
ncbi:MAG: hypothetical protein GYB50_03765 [Rhodobacteraceae bacterium]|nr:hypothetical protein [Paracoccaceae bacterium]